MIFKLLLPSSQPIKLCLHLDVSRPAADICDEGPRTTWDGNGGPCDLGFVSGPVPSASNG